VYRAVDKAGAPVDFLLTVNRRPKLTHPLSEACRCADRLAPMAVVGNVVGDAPKQSFVRGCMRPHFRKGRKLPGRNRVTIAGTVQNLGGVSLVLAEWPVEPERAPLRHQGRGRGQRPRSVFALDDGEGPPCRSVQRSGHLPLG
jgi:hypothetical protein